MPYISAVIVAAGATLVRDEEDLSVYTDPEGNEFCLLRERRRARRRHPADPGEQVRIG